MTGAIVKHQPNGGATALTLGKAADLDPFQVGQVLAASGFFPDARQEAQAVAKVIAGMEMGFGPMAAMTGIHIIEGKPTLSANLLATCVKRHPRYDYRVREHGEAGCRIEFFENEESIGESVFSVEDAQRAGIANKGNFKRYPKAMMFARALSQGVRWYCPDVTAGAPAYVPEELGAEVNEEGEPVEPQAPTPEPQTEPEADANPELVERTLEGIKALRLPYSQINLMLGSVGADAPKINRPDSILKALRALSAEQHEEIQGRLHGLADEASEAAS